MRRILLNICVVLLLIGVVTSTIACGMPTVLRQPVAEAETYDLSVVKTIGNHSYAPLYFANSFPEDDQISKVLGFLQVFERAHPELEVTNWRTQDSNSTLYGIWIDHRPKR